MKNRIYILGFFLSSLLIFGSCVQSESSENMNPDSYNTEQNIDESIDNLEEEFEQDAQEMGRLKCLERKASENNDEVAHDRIEGEKMLLRQKMEKKYKEFIGKQEYDEKYQYNEEIGKKICAEF